MKISKLEVCRSKSDLDHLSSGKVLINTINAHSFNMAQTDEFFSQALTHNENVLIADGVSIVWALRLLTKLQVEKIAGADLFDFEMKKLNQTGGVCFFLGSTDSTLKAIRERAQKEYPNIEVKTYSPPYKKQFSAEDNQRMIEIINEVNPDLLWVGMTAPKQEKWAYENFSKLNVKGHIGCIGAVFDFYAGNINRAPNWMINLGLEWFYRLINEPSRLWKRYLIGNTKFIWSVMNEFRTLNQN